MGDYHHGDLRRQLIEATALRLAEHDPAGLSLRELARDAGVSHAAPRHHFGDKTGLLTAVAAQGFDKLADALTSAKGDLLEAGVAYVGFARSHPGHFAVMFRRDLLDASDAALTAGEARASEALADAVESGRPELSPQEAAVSRIAAWSIAHGLAHLLDSGALPADPGRPDDPEELARAVLSRLFQVPA